MHSTQCDEDQCHCVCVCVCWFSVHLYCVVSMAVIWSPYCSTNRSISVTDSPPAAALHTREEYWYTVTMHLYYVHAILYYVLNTARTDTV